MLFERHEPPTPGLGRFKIFDPGMFKVIGDEKLPSYVGDFFINHYMDPVLKQPVNFMEAVLGRVF